MTETIDMIADEPVQAPTFGGETRVLSERELDGLLDATVSSKDLNSSRAPKQTVRIEALAKILPKEQGAAGVTTQEAALLDAALHGTTAEPASAETSAVVSATTTPDANGEITRGPLPVAPRRLSLSWVAAFVVLAAIAVTVLLSR